MNTLTEKTRLFQHFPPPTFVRVAHGPVENKVERVWGELCSHLFEGGT